MQLEPVKNAVLVIQFSVQCHCQRRRVNRCRVMQVCTVHALSYPCYLRTALSQQLFVHISCSTVHTTRFCCSRLLPPSRYSPLTWTRYLLTRVLVHSFFCHIILSTVRDLSMCNDGITKNTVLTQRSYNM